MTDQHQVGEIEGLRARRGHAVVERRAARDGVGVADVLDHLVVLQHGPLAIRRPELGDDLGVRRLAEHERVGRGAGEVAAGAPGEREHRHEGEAATER